MKVFATGTAILFSTTTWACLWDSDTLAMEANGKLDIVDAITGRFPRNPPLYYEMRLERVNRELSLNPSNLELYDDAGVACDRLGKGEDAIAWMQKKLKTLKTLDDKDAKVKDHWYRYYANLGTFEIHKWFREGHPIVRIAVAERARDHIAKAIEINPDAHFGREKVQLMAMDWAIALSKGKILNTTDDTLAHWISAENASSKKFQETIKGLTGLVVLGNAWESPDVFHALATLLAMSRDGQLGMLAKLRTEELLKGDKPSLSSELGQRFKKEGAVIVTGRRPSDTATTVQNFENLRRAADDYHESRLEFMNARLRTQRHPDTDPRFWDGFVELKRPDLIEPAIWVRWFDRHNPNFFAIGTFLAFAVLVPAYAVSKLRRRRKLSGKPA